MTSPSGSPELHRLGEIIEQLIEHTVDTAVAKAVTKAVNEVVTEAVTKAVANATAHHICTSCSNRSSDVTKEELQASVDNSDTSNPGSNDATVAKRVPPEVWERVFRWLYPSQLSRISMVCRIFADIVAKLPVWTILYSKAHPTNQNHLVGGIKLVVGKNPTKEFMKYVCAESSQICELCYLIYSGTSEVSVDRLAYLPLPVHVWRVRAALKKAVFLPLSSKVGPKDWVVRLCVNCRKSVFGKCPESIPESVGKLRTSSAALYAKYHLTCIEPDVFGFNQPPYCTEESVLVKARSIYGGDIGIKASAPGSSAKVFRSMKSRLEEICLRLTIEAMDG
ncbi:hypothetical protein BGX31_007149 [Mortierella sp. GBA43]|nr:hypothetical protein BGX31_007149 [Mortierella sp. GBA43]